MRAFLLIKLTNLGLIVHAAGMNGLPHVAPGGKRSPELGTAGITDDFHAEIRFNLVNKCFNGFAATVDTFAT